MTWQQGVTALWQQKCRHTLSPTKKQKISKVKILSIANMFPGIPSYLIYISCIYDLLRALKQIVLPLGTTSSIMRNSSFTGLKLEFHRLETLVSSAWNYLFQGIGTRVSHRWNYGSKEWKQYRVPDLTSLGDIFNMTVRYSGFPIAK